MKVIFCGTPDFSVPFLKSLVYDDRFEVQAVITQPDKPVGRKKVVTPPPVKVYAQENDIPVLQPEKNKKNIEFIDLIKGMKPDFIVVVAYGLILPKEILETPKFGCINIHASLLPNYRGASPIQTALLNGDKETGISIMEMNEELDAGDIYLLKRYEISDSDTTETLLYKLSEFGAVILPTILKDISSGTLTSLPQDEEKATYCKKFSKKDAEIFPQKDDADKIINKLRAFTPWPGIFFIFKNKRLKIISAKVNNSKLPPGELKESEGKLILGTANGSLELTEVQLEGKNKMSGTDFINGFL